MMANYVTSGFSDEANLLAQAANRERYRLRQSAALGNQQLFSELAAVWEECSEPNWDGHGALAICPETLRQAYCLLETLPFDLPLPSIGAEPDGQITLDWHHSSRRTLSISVTADGELHYAALVGPNREFGTEACFGELPPRILSLIKRVFRRC